MLFFTRRALEGARYRRIRASGRFRPTVDGLESRWVLSPGAAPAAAAIAPAQVNNLLTINDINLTNLQVSGTDRLLATLDITGTLAGRSFRLPNVQVPITLAQTGTTADGCPILNLAVGPLDLNVLGLRVQLNNCATPAGPVTVDITAVPGAGNLLGNLLCDLTNALPGNLLGDLTALTSAQQGSLTQALTGLLNGAGGQAGLLDSLLGGATPVTGSSHGPRTCNILDLELNSLQLNLLGLEVQTSDICLSVFAQRGRGNLLGNLLCNITGIFDRTGRIPPGLLRNLVRGLDRIPALV